MVAAKNLNIPVYYFFTSGACVLAAILYFPRLDQENQGSFKDMNKLIYLPGLPPIPTSDMPVATLDRNSRSYSDGIIINTFGSQEPKPVKAITDGLSKKLKEIAKGLELSRHRFLWVIRSQPTIKKEDLLVPPHLLDLNTLLPDGFLERTRHRGIVVNKWAPQVAVLNHKSVGGFVTHCGWNSVLEATCAGVPMVAWPLYAEQKMNRIVMVEEMKLALPMDEIEGGKVAAAQIEKRIRQLMESEEGNFIREVVKGRKEDAVRAVSKGGSSHVALAKLVECWDV
ncbi:UDP-glycosyltransferase 88F3 [Artemisia annua]|uniref:UDP-glycosyltransferase 88F3 n=1 Tax=Artemisia annua TaxID=35608 RepID=A0A2U1NY05_ARTAN|nr:UDP-glycosyltransferase 88F3 [Artemisia annua]